MTITRADLGQKVYETLSLLFTRYSAPARQAPLADMLDGQQRYGDAVVALQELAGTRVGLAPTVSSEDSQRRVSSLNVLTQDVKRLITSLMKGKDYEIRIPSKSPKMRNNVDYKHYDVLAFVTSESKTIVFALTDRGQYIFSDAMYWTAL